MYLIIKRYAHENILLQTMKYYRNTNNVLTLLHISRKNSHFFRFDNYRYRKINLKSILKLMF